MIKRKKGLLILTTAITLVPMLLGLILWNRLPEQVPTHWDMNGNIDGWSSKAFAVFGLPLFMAAVHLFCSFATALDPKNGEISGKILSLVLWICPVMSIACGALIYSAALGYELVLGIPVLMCLLFGVMFLFIGNYLPKCKRNYTVGIKVPWALEDEENWNRTHRFAGWLWTLGGLLTLATAFLGNFILFLAITLVISFAPMVYSYLYYRKHKKGTV